MAEPISGKCMHRVPLADGQLQVLTDKDRVIIQLRSPKIVTETDAVSPACKIGVVLDPIEAVRLMGILASAECMQRLSNATGKSE
jgi:hypothetical protein